MELQRIRESLAAGRLQMDNYRAVFISEEDGDPRGTIPYIWYRKGGNFRADYIVNCKVDRLQGDRPVGDHDLGTWWRKRVHFFRWLPVYITRGGVQYYSERGKDGDGRTDDRIVKVRTMSVSDAQPGEVIPPEYSMRPEFSCRPPLGWGAPNLEASLDEHPIDGPAGCVLLTIRRTNKGGGINEYGIGAPDESRFWLDPDRDFIVMRWDTMKKDAAGQAQLHDSTITEAVGRSPRGIWYATRIRVVPYWRTPDGQQVRGSVYQLYVDFDVDLPDAMFNPPALGKYEGDGVFGD